MASISKSTQDRLDSLESAAHSGQLGRSLSMFVLQTVKGVYSAPGNFHSSEAIDEHLETLTYLINLHVYK